MDTFLSNLRQITHTKRVKKALQRENIPYELITFEDEGHGIARPKNLEVLYPRLADFFHKAFDASL
jgi:dipeptidyl aminopeptidase/acylaminoacyl peptidase